MLQETVTCCLSGVVLATKEQGVLVRFTVRYKLVDGMRPFVKCYAVSAACKLSKSKLSDFLPSRKGWQQGYTYDVGHRWLDEY